MPGKNAQPVVIKQAATRDTCAPNKVTVSAASAARKNHLTKPATNAIANEVNIHSGLTTDGTDKPSINDAKKTTAIAPQKYWRSNSGCSKISRKVLRGEVKIPQTVSVSKAMFVFMARPKLLHQPERLFLVGQTHGLRHQSIN